MLPDPDRASIELQRHIRERSRKRSADEALRRATAKWLALSRCGRFLLGFRYCCSSGAGLGHLLNKSDLIDLLKSGVALAHLGQAGVPEEGHSFLPRCALDFRSGPTVDNHFADAIGEIQKFGDGGPTVKTGAGTFQAARALGKRNGAPNIR